MDAKNIRNFSIIAHIDHGKSTLADRMLQITGTIPERKMREQVLDSMELERERGITIKMTPVRMSYTQFVSELTAEGFYATCYTLNLIDTPGHIDFSYEVSRSLKAVEGAILLVDSTQGVQAQTLTTLSMAEELGLVIIPVVTKIDSSLARVPDVKKEISALLHCSEETILSVSGKTGEGVKELLAAIVERVPPPTIRRESASNPRESASALRALVFDYEYSSHRGVVVYARLMSGAVKKGEKLLFAVTSEAFESQEVGVFSPAQVQREELCAGEIGYIVTGLKEPGKALVGDTITSAKNPMVPLTGYQMPQPVVWASLYPESQDDFSALRQALSRLKLSDASISYEEEMSPTLGRGFRCGFLGMLHIEIVVERLKREFSLSILVTAPAVAYEIVRKDGTKKKIYSPAQFPDDGAIETVYEPWVRMQIIVPQGYLGDVLQLLYAHEAVVGDSESFSRDRLKCEARIPLRELMRGFFDEVKSVSSGYASFSYIIDGTEKASVTRLDIMVADEVVPAFSSVVAKHRAYEEAKRAVDRLYTVLPRQLFAVKIQGSALGRVLSSKTLTALKKDVTGYLYGGDITRKRKLWEKQKRGKKKMKERGKVHIPHDVFLKMIKAE